MVLNKMGVSKNNSLLPLAGMILGGAVAGASGAIIGGIVGFILDNLDK